MAGKISRSQTSSLKAVASVFGVGCGLGINSQHRWWHAHLSDKARRFLAHLWPGIFKSLNEGEMYGNENL